MSQIAAVAPTRAEPATAKSRNRTRLFAALAAGVVVLGAGYYAYDTLIAAKHAYTDDAYVGADIAQITPQVGGPVKEVRVEDTQTVKLGDVLVVLDDTDARLALALANAQLELAERKYRAYAANDTALAATVESRTAEQTRAAAQLAVAEAELNKAHIDLDRRKNLIASGSVSGDELTAAQNTFSVASANMKVAQAAEAQSAATHDSAIGNREANQVLYAGTTADTNPEVAAARAQRDQAQVDLDRTVVRSPIDGVVSRRQVQVGQRVQPGMMLMVVVPVQAAYVDANFKEIQLEKVRPGQPVTLESDLYGSSVEYHGHVTGFSGGTGAAFAIVPAQNATGNWIKVVQRLPVRIAIDPRELADHPLRVGLSMTADIDLVDKETADGR
jgi:membrane fusion protein (multidrug efflux system)